MSSPRKPPGPAMKTPSVAAPVPDGGLSGRELCKWSVGFGLIYVLLHIPFLSRYDLFLSSGNAQCYLMMKRILSGELYIYQWAGDYTGMGPVDFVTALLFAIFKPSLALCTFVNLLFWGLGILLRSASVLEGVSTTAMPSLGQASARAAIASEPLSGSACGGSLGSGRGTGAGRSAVGTASTSHSRARPTSPTIASPIGARAASPGSEVRATSSVPGASSAPGM